MTGIIGLALSVETVPISIQPHASAHVPPEFLSITMDAGEFFPGHFWHQNASFPFHSKAMLSLARGLAPAFFRMGGTEADRLWYDVHDCFTVDRCGGKAKSFKEAIPKNSIDELFEFAQSAGHTVVFGLNAVVGPRNHAGEWVPDNAAELIQYVANTYPNTSGWWELGNEPEAFALFQHMYIGVDQLIRDYQTLRRTLQHIAPSHKVAGIDSFGNPPFTGPDGLSMLPFFLAKNGSAALDAITYHWYPLIGNCGGLFPDSLCKHVLPSSLATVEKAVTKAFNDTEEKLRHMQALVKETGKPLWIGEGALAAAGGRNNVTNRFASSLFYLFELGQAAITGHSVVMRQCFTGAAYSLVDIDSQTPLPDYWAALLHKRLMGAQVHRVSVSLPLRVFAHCHPSWTGQITVMVVNPTAQVHQVSLPQAGGRAILHNLTADDMENPLLSSSVRINGKRMSALDGEIPTIPPNYLHAGHDYTISAFSAAFFTFAFDACSPAQTIV